MRAQEQLGCEVEGVPVLAGGMAGRDVERFEVVPLGLDLGAELDVVAEALEDSLDLPLHLREHVDVPASERWTGERDVDCLGLGDVREACPLELGAPRGKGDLDRAFGLVRGLTQGGSFRRSHLADARQQAAHLAALASQVVERNRLELAFRARFRDIGERVLGQLNWIAHAARLRRTSSRITAAAAATLRDSTPALNGMVTSVRLARERPWASLPRTIMPAFSIGDSASGTPPAAAAPKPSSSARSSQSARAIVNRNTFPADARTALAPNGSALPSRKASAGAPAAAAVRQIAPTLPGSCTRSSTTRGQRPDRAAAIASLAADSRTLAIATTPWGVTVWLMERNRPGDRVTRRDASTELSSPSRTARSSISAPAAAASAT